METYVLQDSVTSSMTDEEFLKFCLENPTLRIERDSNLQIIIMPPVSTEFGFFSGEPFRQLSNWSVEMNNGITFDSSTGFRLPDNSVRSPDAAWVSKKKWKKLSSKDKQGFAPLCPEFIIEVKSKHDHLEELRNKMKNVWIRNGAQLAWLIDPQRKTSYIYRSDGTHEKIKGFKRVLVGEGPVAGFNLDLSKLTLR